MNTKKFDTDCRDEFDNPILIDDDRELCIECHKPLIIKTEPNGADDFNTVAYCSCGATYN